MDSVRFGRALGFGARSAAKALVTAVDAASSPNPRAPQSQSQAGARPATATAAAPAAPHPAPRQPIQTAARAASQIQKNVEQTRAGVARGGKRLGSSVWRPMVKLSGVLWLEMTGSFFALFALYCIQGIWRGRADVHATVLNHTSHLHLLINCGAAVMFTYFSVSSFLKARRRSRSSH